LGAPLSVLELLAALLKAIWPDTENVDKSLSVLAFWSLGRSWRHLGSVLERLGGEGSWSLPPPLPLYNTGNLHIDDCGVLWVSCVLIVFSSQIMCIFLWTKWPRSAAL
jgi:hypothetical protein